MPIFRLVVPLPWLISTFRANNRSRLMRLLKKCVRVIFNDFYFYAGVSVYAGTYDYYLIIDQSMLQVK